MTTKEDFDERIVTEDGSTLCISMGDPYCDEKAERCLIGCWNRSVEKCNALLYLTDAMVDQLIASLQAYKAAA